MSYEQIFAEADRICQKYSHEEVSMTKSIGFFGADCNIPAIAQFAQQFEDTAGNCTLIDRDKAALVGVLGVRAWGLYSELQDDFWQAVNDAIGDGVNTSLEEEEFVDDEFNPDRLVSPLGRALSALSTLSDAAQCYSIIAWLVQE